MDLETKATDSFDAKDVFAQAAELPETKRLVVTWYQEPIGTMAITGDTIRWEGFKSPAMEKLFGQVLPVRESDNMPQFLANIFPDNDVFAHLGINSQAEYILSGLRFFSNTLISRTAPFDRPVTNDYLQVNFDEYVDETGVFTGTYYGRPPKSLEEDELAKELSKVWANPYVPRFSGKELKLPVTIHEKGEVQKSITSSFTHFIKFPNTGYKEGWGVNEWMCMRLAEATGLPTAKNALIQIDENMPPAYLVERFDLCDKSRQGLVRRLMHDFCTLAGMRPLKGLKETKKEGITAGTLEQVAKTLRKYSTDPEQDVEDLFKRSLVSIAVADGDMHRKNISMLFRYDEKTGEIISARMSPAYDITSEIYQRDEDHGMVLPMNGRRNKFDRKTLLATAKTMGIPEDRANKIIDHTFTTIAAKAVEIAQNLPDIAKMNDFCIHTAQRIATIAVGKAGRMGCPTPDWKDVPPMKIKFDAFGQIRPPFAGPRV